MKSPFPGMDPFLEAHWGDVHSSLVLYTRDALQRFLPEDLRARVEERVYLEKEESRRQFVPDVRISERERWAAVGASTAVAEVVAVAEPLVVELEEVEITEGFIEIRERGGGKLITLIEFLSPANKSGGVGEQKYREKQDEVLGSDASLVEIDLIRAGDYVLAAPETSIPEPMRRDYFACISPGWRHTRFELYRLPLRARLPVLPIPLRDGEPRVPLDLQALLEQAYRAGRYGDLDYSAALDTPLAPDDAAWASTLLVQRATT